MAPPTKNDEEHDDHDEEEEKDDHDDDNNDKGDESKKDLVTRREDGYNDDNTNKRYDDCVEKKFPPIIYPFHLLLQGLQHKKHGHACVGTEIGVSGDEVESLVGESEVTGETIEQIVFFFPRKQNKARPVCALV